MWKKTLHIAEWVVNLLSVALLIYISAALMRSHVDGLPPARIAPLRTGQAVPINGVGWSKSHHTLVLALQTTCHYCAASAPFYKELLEKRDAGAWQAVAVLPQPTQRSTAYMQAEGYSVPEVRQMNLGLIGVDGTPTLLLVSQKGKLEKEWVGEPSPSGEDEVAEALGVGKLAQGEPTVLVAGMGFEPPTGSAGDGRTTAAPAQSQQLSATRSVRLQHRMPDDPVRIVQVLDGSQDVTPRGWDKATGQVFRSATGRPFQTGEDWVKDLVFVAKNLSSKEIIAADFDVSFPQTGNGTPDNPITMYMVMLGHEPENINYTSSLASGPAGTRAAGTVLRRRHKSAH